MAAPTRRLAELADDERRETEAWLADFHRDWAATLLPARVREIPPDRPWRVALVHEMVRIDLGRQWALGNRPYLETYLARYPELGTPADVDPDLVRAEFTARRESGEAVNLDDYAGRFPAATDALRGEPGSGPVRDRAPVPAGAPDPVRLRPFGESVPELPSPFGRYRIVRRLGSGGMGSVYLAEDTTLGRKVALKVAHIASADGPEVVERFHREARALALLDHPYICKVFDVGAIDGTHYLTMEYIEGKTLGDSVAGQADLSERQVAAIVGKLALALQEAHANGVLHRDLKPANVMIRQKGQKAPVIIDFGLVRREAPGEKRLTQTGQWIGTPHYMAPEQINCDFNLMGPPCDVYALGVILYELLTDRLPFDGPNAMAVTVLVLTQKPEAPSKHRPDLDPRLEAICLKAMARKIEDRYATMSALAAALAEFLKSPQTVPTPPPASPQASAVDPARHGLKPMGPDTLMGKFLERVAAEEQAEPLHDRAVSAAPKPRSSRPSWNGPLSAAVAASAVLLLAGVFYVAAGGARTARQNPGGDHESLTGTPESPADGLTPSVSRSGASGSELEASAGTPLETVAPDPGPSLPTGPVEVVTATPPDLNGVDTISLQDGETITTKFAGIRLRKVPAGEFLMGAPAGDALANDWEKPQHRVRITRPFYIGVTEVTQGQYLAATGERPSRFHGSDELPVEQVNWLDAVRFCNALSAREGTAPFYRIDGAAVSVPAWTGPGYRLPTDAEWEYACRAGSTTRYGFGDEPAPLGQYAWFKENSGGRTHPVGQQRPNAWGLFDMHGNVWEWCWDLFEPTYYAASPVADPPGPLGGFARVVRGGSWSHLAPVARSARRKGYEPDYRNAVQGFRVARR